MEGNCRCEKPYDFTQILLLFRGQFTATYSVYSLHGNFDEISL